MVAYHHTLIAVVLMLPAVEAIIAADIAPPKAMEPTIAKKVLGPGQAGENLLRAGAWRPYEKGFQREGAWFVCDNGADAHSRRGAAQNVALDQTRPEPIVASCWSRAEDVGGSEDSDYSLYIDLVYTDGTTLWGQVADFGTATHDWQRRQVVVLPEKPVKQLSFNMLLRGHAGKAWFRDAELRVVCPPAGACLFDGIPVMRPTRGSGVRGGGGFQLRDVAAGSDWILLGPGSQPRVSTSALGIKVAWDEAEREGARFYDVSVEDASDRDRAITLVFALPVDGKALRWLADPRRSAVVEPGGEYMVTSRFQAGANGRISRYPLGAVADRDRGLALGIDPACPAQFRVGYSEGSAELYLAYDLGLAAENRRARIRFCRFGFEPGDGFRGALSRYYALFPDAFRCRTPEQGLWMPFAKISQVQGWEDFGFKFKEGNDETAWDDKHGIITFRYTEPMTWWMPMAKGTPRTLAVALAEARRLADQGNTQAKALFTSGYHDAQGRLAARLLDTPWCNGAVWSMNSMPGIAGEITDFKNKWSPAIQADLYGNRRHGDLDGEYIDSSEGYVTDELDFRRDHFAAVRTPLTFSPEEHRPAIFRGLIAFEYVRGIETDIHAQGKLMMANGAPDRLCWLAPLLDVLGTETDWHSGRAWQPMSDAELLYRRAMCKGKPFCFLMNTRFEDFSHELVEKYMKRCLAYGMFPGFFSHNAAQGHYFTRPELYDRDRPLFKRYVPVCKRVAEAGWEPITRAWSDDEHVYVERFGNRLWTIFNDSHERRTPTITWADTPAGSGRELLSGRAITWRNRATTLSLEGEDVAVIEIDIRNEPCAHTPTPARWGGKGPTDIHAMYEAVGNAILAVNPDALIICEAVINYKTGAFEGDLSVVRRLPIVLSNPAKLVYSVDEYPSEIGGYRGPESGAGYIDRMNKMWGWLIAENVAPVWIGEMGASMASAASKAWGQTLLDYMNGKTPGGPTFAPGQQPIGGDWWAWGCLTGQNPNGCVGKNGKVRPEQAPFIDQMLYRPATRRY